MEEILIRIRTKFTAAVAVIAVMASMASLNVLARTTPTTYTKSASKTVSFNREYTADFKKDRSIVSRQTKTGRAPYTGSNHLIHQDVGGTSTSGTIKITCKRWGQGYKDYATEHEIVGSWRTVNITATYNFK